MGAIDGCPYGLDRYPADYVGASLLGQVLNLWDESKRGFRLGGLILIFYVNDIGLILGISLDGIVIDIKKVLETVVMITFF